MRALLIGLAVGALLPAAVSAQDIPLVPGTLEFAPIGGASIPFGDFNLVAEPGYGIGGTLSFYVMPNLAVGAGAAYNSYGLDVDPTNTASRSMWEFTGHAKYLLIPGPVSPYLKGTAGLYRQSFEAEGSPAASSSDLGVGGGMGIQLHIPGSQFGIFGESVVNVAFTENTNTTYYTLRAGLNFTKSVR